MTADTPTRFKLLQELGKDTTGTLFLGRCLVGDNSTTPRKEQEVLLKVIAPHLARSPKLIARFREICQAQAAMQHQNIVPVYAFEQEKKCIYIVMAYPGTPTLANLLETKGNFSIASALDIFIQVLAGTGYAHSHQLLHKNICPANVFMGPGNPPHVQIKDFGLAGEEEIAVLPRLPVPPLPPTVAAPEQLRGQDATITTDIYGLGNTLYEMLAGSPPFLMPDLPSAGSNFNNYITKLVLNSKPRSLVEIDPHFPAGLDAVIMKCLAKSPGDRFPNVSSLEEKIVQIRHSLPAQMQFYKLPSSRPLAAPAQVPGAVPPGGSERKTKVMLPEAPSPSASTNEKPAPAPKKINSTTNPGGGKQKYLAIAAVLLVVLVIVVVWAVRSAKTEPLTLASGSSRTQQAPPPGAATSAPVTVTRDTSETPKEAIGRSISPPGQPIIPAGSASEPQPLSPVGGAIVLPQEGEQPVSSDTPQPQPGNSIESSIPSQTTPPVISSSATGDTSSPGGNAPSPNRLIEKMDLLIRAGDIAEALQTGQEALASGNSSGELLREIARAYFYDGQKEKSLEYFQRAMKTSGAVIFPVAYRYEKDKEIAGNLEITPSRVSFRPTGGQSQSNRNNFSASYPEIVEVFHHLMGDISGLFKKKKNRDNPMLVIGIMKQYQKTRYTLRLTSPDPKLRRFLKYILNSLRRTHQVP